MSLKEDVQEVDGVGEVKAAQIAEIVEEHDVDSTIRENIRQAYDYYQAGRQSYAKKFLQRAYEEL